MELCVGLYSAVKKCCVGATIVLVARQVLNWICVFQVYYLAWLYSWQKICGRFCITLLFWMYDNFLAPFFYFRFPLYSKVPHKNCVHCRFLLEFGWHSKLYMYIYFGRSCIYYYMYTTQPAPIYMSTEWPIGRPTSLMHGGPMQL